MIRKGGFATVYRSVLHGEAQVAVKLISGANVMSEEAARGLVREVLSLFTCLINKLQALMTAQVPRVFEAVFKCTLDMITKNFEKMIKVNKMSKINKRSPKGQDIQVSVLRLGLTD